MMRQPDRKPRLRDTVFTSGWLFADLLLALAVIFLAANTIGVRLPLTPTPTPKPTAIAKKGPTPTPTPEPRLDFNPQPIQLKGVNWNGLLNDSSQAINDFKGMVESQSILKGRRVGLTLVSGGAPTDNDIPQAQNIADKVISILEDLGKQGFPPFKDASYYKPLYRLPSDPSIVEIDVYLFKK